MAFICSTSFLKLEKIIYWRFLYCLAKLNCWVLKYVCFLLMFENKLSQMVRFRHLMSIKFNPNQFIDKIGCAYIWKCLWYTEVGGKLKWRNCFQKISFSTNCSACVTLVNIEASVLIDCLASKIRCSVIRFVVLVVWYSI